MIDEIDIVEMKAAFKGIIEFAPIHAKAVRAYYKALIDEGFTKIEALRIVEKHGYMPPSAASEQGGNS